MTQESIIGTLVALIAIGVFIWCIRADHPLAFMKSETEEIQCPNCCADNSWIIGIEKCSRCGGSGKVKPMFAIKIKV